MLDIDRELRERLVKLQNETILLGQAFEMQYTQGMQLRRSPVADDPRDEANQEASVFCFNAVDLFRRANEILKNNIK